MKQLLLSLAFALATICCTAQTPDLTRNSTAQKDTTIKAVSYKIYVGSRGGRFIIVTSKTGTQYRKYLKK